MVKAQPIHHQFGSLLAEWIIAISLFLLFDFSVFAHCYDAQSLYLKWKYSRSGIYVKKGSTLVHAWS